MLARNRVGPMGARSSTLRCFEMAWRPVLETGGALERGLAAAGHRFDAGVGVAAAQRALSSR
ncbi:MAG: hypothetical protein Q8L14_41730 [Myxococcales bacterium]|nr:hypothetical protein [Myxococcales bacterium]